MTAQTLEHALYYSDALIEKLELRWGDGFMSPGGASELRRMLGRLDVAGQTGLDLDCGVGGYDALLVEQHGAAKVTGVDIDAATIATAQARAARAGLSERLEFRHIAPGPLPFADGAFDFVFSKDAIVDLPEKPPVFKELFRVAKPGGAIIVSDWFRSAAPYTEEMRRWATTGDETYEMDTLQSAARYVSDAGFVDVEEDDRNAWFRAYARDEYERLNGPLFAIYCDKFGEQQATESVENAKQRWVLAEQGQLRPGHVRARKTA